uniref:C-type lectin domain-containing protein n=1 Tax=Acrobeloides nanus TaxID=290746 RepID=A0A914DHN1_9BILA
MFFIYVFFLLSVLTSTFDACPKDSIQGPNNLCYQAFNIPSNWLDAEAYCENTFGFYGHLVSITDAYVNAFLYQNVSKSFNTTVTDYWTGGEDNYYDRVFYWTWSDYQGWEYTNWAPGEPTNNDNNCVAQKSKDGQWISVPYELKKPFICEFP